MGPLGDPSRSISLSNFKAPACAECNHGLSDFENTARDAFQSVHRGVCSRDEIGTILDWMDKFRTIYWLYLLAINKQSHSIKPRFAAFDRIGLQDRYVNIYRLPSESEKGVTILDGSQHAYMRQPSVLGLIIRDIVIVSYSEAAAMLDYFGATSSTGVKLVIGGPVTRVINPDFRLKPLDSLVRTKGLQAITFANSANFLAPVQSLLVQKGKIPEPALVCERFNVPRVTLGRSSAFHLAHLSVLELQVFGQKSFDNYELRQEDRIIIQKVRRELDALINGELLQLNNVSLFKYSRKFPEIFTFSFIPM